MKTPNYVSPLDLQRMDAKAQQRRQVREYLRKSSPLKRHAQDAGRTVWNEAMQKWVTLR